jgi:WD40 repeat protein/serine/threonine protein kinase
MSSTLVTDFRDALRQLHLLESDQLDQLARPPLSSHGKPRELAGELIRLGWLTPYQANQLLQGHGASLLLGSYVLLQRLGEGGMGQVFKARNWKLGRVVALKVIRKEWLTNEAAVRRFRREILAAAQLSHPNIVHALDADEVAGSQLLVMEYVEGTDLKALLQKNGPLPIDRACEYARQTALALQHAHERGLVHRDVKPANLLVSPDGQTLKVLDLGLARLQFPETAGGDVTTDLTGEGTVLGTADYVAPEQAEGASHVDVRADLYSLGCSLYQMLTGQVPFPGGNFMQKAFRHKMEEPTPVERLRPDVSPALAAIVRRLMAKRPEDRYQTPAEAAFALQEAGQTLTAPAPARPPDAPRPAAADPFADLRSGDTELALGSTVQQRLRQQRRRRRILVGTTAGLALLGAVAALTWPRNNAAPDTAASRPASVVLTLRPRLVWQDTGVEVSPGQPVIIQAVGRWQKKGHPACSADGLEQARRDRTILAEAPALCLLARIGAGSPSPLGTEHTFEPATAGRLFVQANDLDLEELTGSLELTIKGGHRTHDEAPPPPLLPVQQAEAALKGLTARAADPQADRAQLRSDLLAFGRDWAGLPQGPRGAELLRRLPAPLDQLDPAKLPVSKEAPPGVVAVLGDGSSRLPALAVACSPDDNLLASAVGAEVSLWESATGQVSRVLHGHAKTVRCLAFSRDGTMLASGSDDGTTRLWKVADDQPPAVLATGPVHGIAFSPDGKTLAVGGVDGKLALWELSRQQPVDTWPAHAGGINAIAFSLDGKTLATAGPHGSVKLWDSAAGTVKQDLAAGTASVLALVFGPDGKHLAAGDGQGGGAVWLWDLADTESKPRKLGGHTAAVAGVSFAPDGWTLASAGSDGQVILSDVSSGQALRQWRLPAGVNGLAFASDGRHLVTANANGTACVLRLGPPAFPPRKWVRPVHSPLDELRRADIPPTVLRDAGLGDPARAPVVLAAVFGDGRLRHQGQVFRVVWGADGTRLASASADGTARVWDAATGRELLVIRQPGWVIAVAFSPDGKRLAVGGGQGSPPAVFDASTGKQVSPSLEGHAAFVRSVAFSPTGKALATASQDGVIKLWDTDSWKEICTCRGLGGPNFTVSFSPDGSRLAAAGLPRTVQVWETTTGKEVLTLRAGAPVAGVAFDPAGKRLAAGYFGGLRIWDAGTRKLLGKVEEGSGIFAWRPDGQGLAVALPTEGVSLLDATGKRVAVLPTGGITSLACSPDGAKLATADAFGAVRVWDLKTRREVPLSDTHAGMISALAISPDSSRIATRGADRTVRLWDGKTGRLLLTLPAGVAAWGAVAFSPDGGLLYCDNDAGPGIKVRETATGRELAAWPAAPGYPLGLLVEPDGTRLASFHAQDRTVRLWDTLTGRTLHVVEGTNNVAAACLAPDGRLLARGDVKGNLSLWDTATGGAPWNVNMPERSPSALAFSPDGQLLAVGSNGQLSFRVVSSGKDLEESTTAVTAIVGLAYHPARPVLAIAHANGRLNVRYPGGAHRGWLLAGGLTTVAFAPDGRHVLAGTRFGAVYVLRLGP